MNLRNGFFLRARALAATMLSMAMLLGCGGGVGTGGTGAFVTASVDGFGSVIAGGVEFDDAQAVVLDDTGSAAGGTANQVRLGMMVDVEGSSIVTTPSGIQAGARTIRVITSVIGPVQAVDSNAQTLKVLGQTVQINAATVFASSLRGGLSALRIGQVVAVYGWTGATGSSDAATRIEPAPAATAFRLRGPVDGIDTAAHTFQIGNASLSYASAAGLPSDLANGMVVSVNLPPFAGAGTLAISEFNPASRPQDLESAVVQGLVTSLTSASSFSVDGIPVDASQASIAPSGASVSPNAYAEVHGRMSNGTLVASNLTLLGANALAQRTFVLAGAVSGLDTTAKGFILRNVNVDYSAARFINGAAADLVNGVTLRVEGSLSADGTQVVARTVLFR